MNSNLCKIIFTPFFFVTVSFQHENFDENTITIEKADNEQVMMMVGGMEETEAMGSASNIQKNSLLLFPSGKSCMLKKPIFSYGTSSGFALFDGKTVAVCAGINSEDNTMRTHNLNCQFWNKASGKVEVKKPTGSDSRLIRFQMGRFTSLYPIYSSCAVKDAHPNCVLFILNWQPDDLTKRASSPRGRDSIRLIVAKLINGDVHLEWPSHSFFFHPFPYRSCLVYLPSPANKYLLLGGAKTYIDDQSVSDPINHAEFMNWSQSGALPRVKFRVPKCPLVTRSVYAQCLAFKAKEKNIFHIMMIGGEDHEDEKDPGRGMDTVVFDTHVKQMSYYDGSNKTVQNCKENEDILKPAFQDPAYNVVKGLKDFVAGTLRTKDGGLVTIIAAGGRFGSGERNISISRHVWLVENFTTESENELVQHDFNFHRHSMQPIVVNTNFFEGMECVERKLKKTTASTSSTLNLQMNLLAASLILSFLFSADI